MEEVHDEEVGSVTLREYLQVVRERWLFVTAGLVLGVVAAVVLTVLSPRQYSSTVVLYVASQSTTTPKPSTRAACSPSSGSSRTPR